MITRFLRFPGGKSRALTLSYDDGVVQDRHFVHILRYYGLKCTFNINGGLFPPEGTEFPPEQRHRRMTRNEVLYSYPNDLCEIACHAYTHPRLNLCDNAMATAQVLEDRKALEEMFGRPIQGMAYPYGTYDDRVVGILEACGIRYCRTTVSTGRFDIPEDWLRLPATCHHNDPKLMELADAFLAPSRYPEPRLFYLWGHTYEFDIDNNWDRIEAFARKMARNDEIWYATNMEVYEAWLDFNRLVSTADGRIVTNPNARTVWFQDSTGKLHELLPGQTVTLG